MTTRRSAAGARPPGLAATLVLALVLGGCSGTARQEQAAPAQDTASVPSEGPPPPPPPPPSGQHAKPPSAARGPAGEAPAFPWPPPQPSDLLVIPRHLLAGSAGAARTLSDVDARLSEALAAAGYSGSRYYSVPDGFAIVTRLERIDAHGNPRGGDGRWATGPVQGISLTDLLKGLFRGNPGRYRVFVFVVSARSFAPDTTAATREQAERWLKGGANVLPAEVGEQAYTPAHAVTALVYEFEQKRPDQVAALLTPPSVPAQSHLVRARIWRALGGTT